MTERLRRWLPDPETLQRNRWLRWLTPALRRPKLWHMSRRSIAMGLALGVFFGLLTPVAQIPMSVAGAVVMRANVPVAVIGTLVSNPVTFAPLYYTAWRIGSAVLQQPVGEGFSLPHSTAPPRPGWRGWCADAWDRLHAVGKPLLLGLALLASTVGLSTYFLCSWIWRVRVVRMRRRRLRLRLARAA